MITTSRLRLRPFTPADAPFLLALLNTPGWLQFIGDRGVRSEADAAIYLTDRLIPAYHKKGYGFLCCELIEDQTPIGMCGIIERSYLDDPDIGFAFLPAFTGQGYAYEASQAVMDFADQQLHIKTIVAFTDPVNERSIRLLKKIGLQEAGPFFIPGEKEELLLMSTAKIYPLLK